MNEVLDVYKGTDKDMKCYGGYQYEIGRQETDTDAIRCGNNGCKAKGGKNSVIVLTEWKWKDGECVPVCVKAEIVDGQKIKPDTWYELKDGEFRESEEG